MAHDVFISYSRKDQPIAEIVCHHLEQNGIRCWIAPRDISPGADWAESIVDAVCDSRLMLLIFSANANDSSQINREVNLAADERIPIVPFRVEDVQASKHLKYYLSTPHWLDAFPPPLENHLEHLVKSVKTFIPERQEKSADEIKTKPQIYADESEHHFPNTDQKQSSHNFVSPNVESAVKTPLLAGRKTVVGIGIFLALWIILVAFPAVMAESPLSDQIGMSAFGLIWLVLAVLAGLGLAYLAKINLLLGILGGAFAFSSMISLTTLSRAPSQDNLLIFAIFILFAGLIGLLAKIPILWIGSGLASFFVVLTAYRIGFRLGLPFGIVGLALSVYALLKNRKLHQKTNISNGQN
jgi:hypothetical protein